MTTGAEKKVKRGTAFDGIDMLDNLRRVVTDRLAKIDDSTLVAKCEAMLIGFDELRDSARKMAPNMEQLRGITKGLHLAGPMVGQFVQVLKAEMPDEGDVERLKFGRDVIQRCAKAVNDARLQQRDEMTRQLGVFDGQCHSALAIARKIEGFLANHERLLEEEKKLAYDQFRDPPASGNGSAKPSKKPARKKRAKKTAKAPEKHSN